MIFSLTETLLLLTVMQFEDESIYYNWQGANLCAGYLWSVNFNPIFVITGDSATSDSGCSQLHTTIIVTKLGFSQFQSPPPQSPHPSTIAARSKRVCHCSWLCWVPTHCRWRQTWDLTHSTHILYLTFFKFTLNILQFSYYNLFRE